MNRLATLGLVASGTVNLVAIGLLAWLFGSGQLKTDAAHTSEVARLQNQLELDREANAKQMDNARTDLARAAREYHDLSERLENVSAELSSERSAKIAVQSQLDAASAALDTARNRSARLARLQELEFQREAILREIPRVQAQLEVMANDAFWRSKVPEVRDHLLSETARLKSIEAEIVKLKGEAD